MPRIRQTAVRSHAGAARWTGKNVQTKTVSTETVHVTIQDVGEFDLPAAFLRTFDKYKENWLEVVLRDLFGAESEAASMSVENADPESEEPVHVTLSSRLWTRIRDTRVTFTLADLESQAAEDDQATEDEEADDSKSERESESRDLSVPQIDTPETRFPLPQVVTAAKLGPDPSRWARRFFVCLLGLSEVEYQALKQGKSDLGRIDQDDFLVLREAGWERFKAVPLSLRLRDFLQVEDALKARNENKLKNIKVKVEPLPSAQQPWNRWSGEFTIPRIVLMHLDGCVEWLPTVLATVFAGRHLEPVREQPDEITIVIASSQFDNIMSQPVLSLRLADLFEQEPVRQNSILDVTVVRAAGPEQEALLPVEFVRTQLGPDPRAWGRKFLVQLLGFTEQEYQAVKVGQRPDLVQVKGGRRVQFVFGPLGWSRVSTKELKLSLEDLFRDAQTNFQLVKP